MSATDPNHYEHIAAKTAAVASYASAGATTFFGLTLNEWGVIIGMLCSVLTYATYLYFKIRDDKRKSELAEKLKKLDG
ncbi:MAG: hypothetical protein D6711_16985 [Chloroflexi bacterium]|nr:MAG: hypothetical protein D6711_16985 [Chloroflexota bacterium]